MMMMKKLCALLLSVPAVMATTASASGNECSSEWTPVGTGMNNTVRALTVFDDGSGPELYAGGWFTEAGGSPASHIARWDGTAWSALAGGGVNSAIYTLTVFDDGSGPDLYAGGLFAYTGWRFSPGIARWNSRSWSPMGEGVNDLIFALTVHDDGSGSALYAAGSFTQADGSPANYIARWDGAAWSTLGAGVNGSIRALTIFDDGSGPALYAGGLFTEAGGNPASHIARWDGESWSPLGAGVNGTIDALTVFDDGSGPALYAGGLLTEAGGSRAMRIAKWDGESWSPLGEGILGGTVNALTVFDDGSGPALFAGGNFGAAGGAPASRIARWDGSSWSPLGSGLNNWIYALTVFDDGSGPSLYVGGNFTHAGGNQSLYIARWGSPCTKEPCPADVTDDGFVNLDDLDLVLSNFGQSTSDGDTNNDGVVNLDDLDAVLSAFGTDCP